MDRKVIERQKAWVAHVMNERGFRMGVARHIPSSSSLHVVLPVRMNHLARAAGGAGSDVVTGLNAPREIL